MLVHSGSQRRRPQASADINMVPLIDIMLVLVIVFLVTAPLLTRAVKINLPNAEAQPAPPKVDNVILSLDAAGQLYWDDEKLDWETLAPRLGALDAQAQEPEVHIRADQQIAYKHVVRLMSAVAAAGLSKIGFVTEPRRAD